jgi:uncharacterized damage-inducible protein DinB
MEFNLDAAITVLAKTPDVLRSLLQGLPDELALGNEGEQTWSPFDVLGHLIHGDHTDWVPRARIILQFGESRAFDPFDRTAMFDQSQEKTLDNLLDEFAAARRESLAALNAMKLSVDDLKKTGLHPDPALGRVTLEQLLATWVAHDLSHITQISRTLARQYRDAVGPWRQYLSILQ